MGGLKVTSRRTALGAPAALVLAVGASAADDQETSASNARTLVAFFSRSGNTRVIADQLHRELDAHLFEILPAESYPDDYEQTVERARQERDAGALPELKAKVTTLATYVTVFLGFPIWGETAPPVLRSFLAAHDLSDKVVRPFITHGGYGLGDSLAVLKSHAPHARLMPAFSMEADQERRTMNQVRDWLGSIRQPGPSSKGD
jgi:flavodoxin